MTSLLKRFADISIAKKLYFTVGIMAMLIGLELFALFFSISTLSALRGYVGGEGLWSKGQKDAVYHLLQYGVSRNEVDYQKFKSHLQIPLSDGIARREMMKVEPDMEVIRKAFMAGGVHEDDIDGMVKLMRRFHSNSYISKAVNAWTEAEAALTELIHISEQIHKEINESLPAEDTIRMLLERIEPINMSITEKENGFSYALGAGSRWLEHFVLKMLFGIALTVEISGLLIAIYVNRGLQKGLAGIIEASKAFAKGHWNRRAKVYSKDEIGLVATAYNNMAEKLAGHIRDTELKNKELQQLAYVASHDLQEPLRTMTSLVEMYENEYGLTINDEQKQYLDFISEAATRMQNLTKALLDYSRIGRDRTIELVDTNMVVFEIMSDIGRLIEEKQVKIDTHDLPVLLAYPLELKLLFQNLIVNAIKFQQPGNIPRIDISAEKIATGWKFCVRDNGIGIPMEYQDKIFIIFQRLHNRSKYDGTGIGLAHCAKIAGLHNGSIWVEDSTEGLGSCFCFTIQLSKTENVVPVA
ncbi:hypothetical protein SAMN05421788_10726 [Filimonas lacunae]|uniref:histidine kinase n=1 Tax=Filimonas lacunae TaxID=477680 RepID=A0A173MFW4_9BACT|nr:ATP-binding protein [Filimonas lacunae]BAV06369.1 phytochrome, two-component sensor histidine kinase [Filimonas lacunae]SIT26658.1 hypothetical protein SAMN05421788_10726 [Filimonas lacunae]